MKILSVVILIILLIYFGFNTISFDKGIQSTLSTWKAEPTQTYEIEIEEVDE